MRGRSVAAPAPSTVEINVVVWPALGGALGAGAVATLERVAGVAGPGPRVEPEGVFDMERGAPRVIAAWAPVGLGRSEGVMVRPVAGGVVGTWPVAFLAVGNGANSETGATPAGGETLGVAGAG